MRKMVKLAALPVLLIAAAFLPVSADEDSAALARPGTDGVTAPQVKARSQVAPYYPAPARMARVDGEVVVAATVLRDGTVGEVEVLACNRPAMGFEQSAADAVRHWRFKPAEKDGEAIDSYTLVRLNFAPPYRGMPDGFVRSTQFYAPNVAVSLAGAPPVVPPVVPPITTSATHEFRLIVPLMPDCEPDGGRCLYDERELKRKALTRGEPGPIRPMGSE